MKRFVKAASADPSFDVVVRAEFDKIKRETMIPDSVIGDLEDVVSDFDARFTAVADCFKENFGADLQMPEIDVFSLGDDAVNVVMTAAGAKYDFGYETASWFQSNLQSWLESAEKEIDSEDRYAVKELDRKAADSMAGCTLAVETAIGQETR